MDKRRAYLLASLLIGLPILIGLAIFFWTDLRGAGPAIFPPAGDIAEQLAPSENATDFPLTVPDGFGIEAFAHDLPGARVIVSDIVGNYYVSQPSEGLVSLVWGSTGESFPVYDNLDKPHGLAYRIEDGVEKLYIAEEGRLSRVTPVIDANRQFPFEKLADLPVGGRHTTRTLGFGSDGRLYISIGSSCDTCHEEDPRRAAIYTWDESTGLQPYATGLRNTVFFDWHPVTGEMWGTDMGRDHLGDDLPPDEVNIITEGRDYGWPICYGKNVHDTEFDRNVYVRDPCADKEPSHIDLPAHVAPLGLAFVPEEGWPEDMQGDLLVAEHGSWNRSEPVGYKVVRLKLDDRGNYEGTEDFLSGWLQGGRALGRPVDLLIRPGGELFVSDDKAGIIYRLFRLDPDL